jgi:DNA polymerase-3 subunit beta
MEKDGEKLTLLATDIEIQITTQTPTIGPEKAAMTVGARKLQDILRSLPESAEVSLALDDKRLQLKAGKSRFNLQTLPAEDFPRMTTADGQSSRLSITQKQMKRLLALVQYAMAQQDIRYYLNGLLLVAKGNELRMVATDGHRLAYAAETLPDTPAPIEVILPRKTVLELSRQLADNDDPLEITLTPTQARFSFGSIELVSKLIDGKFPDYERVIPQHHSKLIKLSRDTLLHSLLRAAILTNEKFRGVRLVLGPEASRSYPAMLNRKKHRKKSKSTTTAMRWMSASMSPTYLMCLTTSATKSSSCILPMQTPAHFSFCPATRHSSTS